jgi:hypothetical protein
MSISHDRCVQAPAPGNGGFDMIRRIVSAGALGVVALVIATLFAVLATGTTSPASDPQ